MSIYTDPAHREIGVGTMVLRRAIAWSRAHGYRELTLHSSKMGRPIYRKFGWKPSPEMTLELRPKRKVRPSGGSPRHSGR